MSYSDCPGGAKKWQCASPCDVPYIVCPNAPVVPVDLHIGGGLDASFDDKCVESLPARNWGYLVGDQDYHKCPSLHRSCTAKCCDKPKPDVCPCKKQNKKSHCSCSESSVSQTN